MHVQTKATTTELGLSILVMTRGASQGMTRMLQRKRVKPCAAWLRLDGEKAAAHELPPSWALPQQQQYQVTQGP